VQISLGEVGNLLGGRCTIFWGVRTPLHPSVIEHKICMSILFCEKLNFVQIWSVEQYDLVMMILYNKIFF
jgi:hypothetical protein